MESYIEITVAPGKLTQPHPSMLDGLLNFNRCQRIDGSFYGTAGKCQIGKEVGPRIRELLSKINPNRPGVPGGHGIKPIGEGYFAKAYDLGDGVILKKGGVTSAEAEAMHVLHDIEGIPKLLAFITKQKKNWWGLGDKVIGRGVMIAMEKVPGKPVDKYDKYPELVSQAWENGISILKKIHKANYSHGDIHNGNIMFNPETKKSTLIDFAFSQDDSISGQYDDIVQITSIMSEARKGWLSNPEKFPVITAFMKNASALRPYVDKDRYGAKEKKVLDDFWSKVPD